MKRKRFFIALIFLIPLIWGWAQKSPATEELTPEQVLTDQEIATEKLFSSLEASLAKWYFDYRKRPVVRVAVFDFTDPEGNVVKSGQELADKITKRLYLQSQFDIVDQQKINRYLNAVGLTALGKIDARSLLRLQKRINTMDPANGINALVTGEIQKGEGRSIRVNLAITNFETQFRTIELEKNILEFHSLFTEIPLPTEQAVQEATEIVVRGEVRPLEEGRLLILANTRGNALLESEYINQFNKDNPFPWGQVPFALTMVKEREEAGLPEQIQIGLGKVLLNPLVVGRTSGQRLDYSFLHGKCATNEVYFDEVIPAVGYRLTAAFVDLKNSETYSESKEIPVYAGTTTIVVVSFIMPSRREGTRVNPINRIRVYQIFGKGMDILKHR